MSDVVSDLCSKGNAKFADENFDEALQLYSQALVLDEVCVDALVKRSNCYLKLKEIDNALADAEKALSLDPKCEMAYLRKGMALIELRKFAEAKQILEKGAALSNAGQFTSWIRKCEVALASSSPSSAAATTNATTATTNSTVNHTSSKTDASSHDANGTTATTASATTPAVAEKPSRIRHDWYQSATHVVIEFFAKNVKKENLTVEFREDQLKVVIQQPEFPNDPFEFSTHLGGTIVPPECTVQYLQTKVVLKLKKATGGAWPSLKHDASQLVAKVVPVPEKRHLASFEKNWDSIAKVTGADDPKPEGDEALNALFKQIYKDGTDEQRRAMVKSFTQSGGTCLSTNWDDIKKRDVPVTPPDNVIAKKWEN